MAEMHLGEVLNNGLTFKFYVPAGELDGIEQFVGKFVRVTIDGTLEFIGDLVRVSTWKKTQQGEVVAVYQEVTLLVESIASKEGVVRLPDRKDQFVESFSILYATE